MKNNDFFVTMMSVVMVFMISLVMIFGSHACAESIWNNGYCKHCLAEYELKGVSRYGLSIISVSISSQFGSVSIIFMIYFLINYLPLIRLFNQFV